MEPGQGRARTDASEQGFRKLLAWQKADDLAAEVFRLTEKEMDARHRWLSLQIVRAAFSVTANIAEGYGRRSGKEYKQYLSIAYGSLCELETQYYLSVDLGYIRQDGILSGLMKEVGAILYRLMNPVQV